MITFLEFYEVFMKFVLFKLYQTQGLRYPPTEDQQLMEAGCFLLAIKPTPIDAVVGSDVTSGDNDATGMIEPKDKCEITCTTSSDNTEFLILLFIEKY